MEEEDSEVVRYRRRLDRTPEKEFERLPETEKKLLSTMRGALESCRRKVDLLKDDLTDREKTIEEERTRRKEAEERLRAYLVDPYPTPQVNSELRRRLPRASKSDPLLDREENVSTDEALEEQIENAVIRKNNAKVSSSPGRPESKKPKKKVRRSSSHSRPKINTGANGPDVADGDVEEDVSSTDDERPPPKHSGRNSREKYHPRSLPTHPLQYPPPYYPYSSGYSYPSSPYTSPYHRPLQLTPWSSASSLNMFPSALSPREPVLPMPRIPQSSSLPSLNSLTLGGGGHSDLPDVKERIQSSSLSALSAAKPDADLVTKAAAPNSEPAAHEDQKKDGAPSAGTATDPKTSPTLQNQMSAAPNLQSQSASSISSHYGLPTGLSGGIGPRYTLPPMPAYPVYSPPSYGVGITGAGGELSLLHEEIGRLKEANKQLSEKLRLSNQELEGLKLQIASERPVDGTLDGPTAKQLADFMEEIKTAQGKREKAMEARLRQANEDRDEAVHALARAHEQQTAAGERDGRMKKETVREREGTVLEPPYHKAAPYERSRRHLDMSDSSTDFDSEDEEMLIRERIGRKTQMLKKDSADEMSSDFDRGRKTLLQEVERRQQREREIYQEELQIVMEQRDQAVEQLRREREKQQMQQIHMPGQREQMLMAKITALQQEKDRAYEMIRQLREEQYDMSLLSSLHKALFPDSALNDTSAYEHGSKLGHKTPEKDEEDVKPSIKEDNQLLEQLRQASQQNAALQHKCEDLEAACRREKEERNKLERLNGVLRKKLITVSTGNKQMEEE